MICFKVSVGDVIISIISFCFIVFLFKRKTAYWMRISDWSSDVCSSDLRPLLRCLAVPDCLQGRAARALSLPHRGRAHRAGARDPRHGRGRDVHHSGLRRADLSDRAVGRYGAARQSADLPHGGQRGRDLAAPRSRAGSGALVRAANRGSLTDDFRDHPTKTLMGGKMMLFTRRYALGMLGAGMGMGDRKSVV